MGHRWTRMLAYPKKMAQQTAPQGTVNLVRYADYKFSRLYMRCAARI